MALLSDPIRETKLPERARPVASLKLTPGRERQIDDALALLEAHCGAALAAWGSLTQRQRDDLLAHSPRLARLLDMLRVAAGGEPWLR